MFQSITTMFAQLDPSWYHVLVAVVGSGALGSIATGVVSRDKSRADAAKSIAEASASIVAQLDAQYKQVSTENQKLIQQNRELLDEIQSLHATVEMIPDLETKIDDLAVAVHVLSEQLLDAGIQPAYVPGKLF